MARKPTAAEVARAAGTSPAAVSRAFRADAPLSEEKRRRILSTAAAMGYAPPSARPVQATAAGAVALVAADLANPFYAAALDALSAALHGSGRRLALHAVPPGASVDAAAAQALEHPCEAVIVTSATLSSRLARQCRERGLPVILFNRVQADPHMAAVACDNYRGGRLVAARFAAQGRRRLALIGGRPDTSTHLERRRGFLDGLAEAGLPPPIEAAGDFTYAGALPAARALIADHAPEAIFAMNDVTGFAALDALRDRGLRAGEDVAVVGFDDVPMADWPSFRLTTIRQPLTRMTAETLDLLDAFRARGPEAASIRICPVRLIERASG